ncbi:MAG TPA: DUF72 domain-containing protein [Blastocatellia bacterium]|nr:DUF72 domain-containing protein [Blastocatellia bacterium]
MAGKIHIGTSGWHYDHWKGPFYPENLPASEMLAFYFDYFDTVEINNSFYRMPEALTFKHWHDQTPENFLFAVKGSRYLTHMKKLKEPKEGLKALINRASKLKEKLGPILFQLPPHWKCNPERLSEFLKALPKKHQYTFEFRDPSWHLPEIYDLLKEYNVAFCAYELAGFESPTVITADFTYVRLHGPGGKYQGDYSMEKLSSWAQQIREWRKSLRDIYVYFDNDQAGYAIKNALELKKLLQS